MSDEGRGRRRLAVQPADLSDESRQLVDDGAFLAGGRTDALITLNDAEVQRRAQNGDGAVTDLALLDLFLSMPLGCPIAVSTFTEQQLRLLRLAPGGAITAEAGTVTRLLDRPVQVDAAVAWVRPRRDGGARRAGSWRSSLRRAGRFVGVTSAVVVFPESARVPATKLWEADVLGVGVWQEGSDGPIELVPPAEFMTPRLKAAIWRFEERAFRAWLDPAAGVPSRLGMRDAEDSADGMLW